MEHGGHPTIRPRDAASLILIDRSASVPRVLMGRRARAHAFMPGVYVFPGGRRDPGDSRKSVSAPLCPEVLDRLAIRTPKRFTPMTARGLAIAAAREMEEEVSLSLTPRSEKEAFCPDLSKLRYVARAITPPGQNRRFDTRFFACFTDEIEADTALHQESSELLDLTWLPLDDFGDLPLAYITRVILDDVNAALAADTSLPFDAAIPFYHFRNGRQIRDTI
ncbi:NUDIX hydrolase [Pseudohoeflea suaedae]|uniref:NUDIX hydrolase n=1 Tax=Pseudohoeflea suaedae TaxID=877384 RepID=A0A4R5PRD6_9HYPH|nr:NUDIX hydrolase [Pseudohoeflea suaedae]